MQTITIHCDDCGRQLKDNYFGIERIRAVWLEYEFNGPWHFCGPDCFVNYQKCFGVK